MVTGLIVFVIMWFIVSIIPSNYTSRSSRTGITKRKANIVATSCDVDLLQAYMILSIFDGDVDTAIDWCNDGNNKSFGYIDKKRKKEKIRKVRFRSSKKGDQKYYR